MTFIEHCKKNKIINIYSKNKKLYFAKVNKYNNNNIRFDIFTTIHFTVLKKSKYS